MNSSVSVVSNAQSVAQSTVSQLDVKARANQTKTKLKTLLKNIDQGHQLLSLTLLRQAGQGQRSSIFHDTRIAWRRYQ